VKHHSLLIRILTPISVKPDGGQCVRAGFTSSSDGVRALVSNAKKELGGEER
jgi:hypothetical protein